MRIPPGPGARLLKKAYLLLVTSASRVVVYRQGECLLLCPKGRSACLVCREAYNPPVKAREAGVVAGDLSLGGERRT